MPSASGWVYVRKRKTKAGQPGHWPEKKKTEVALTFLTTGSITKTVMVTGVPKQTIETWRRTPWWKEVTQELMDEDNIEIDATYTKIIKKALEVTGDRLENGNFQLNQKTGEVVRIPVTINDANKVLKDVAEQRIKLRDQTKGPQEKQETVNDKLIKLASQFAEMALGKKQDEKVVGEVYDGDWEETSGIQSSTIQNSEVRGDLQEGSRSNPGECYEEGISKSEESKSPSEES